MVTNRRKAGEFERIALSVNEMFERQIIELSAFYKMDQSNTLTLILDEILNNPNLQEEIKNYVKGEFRMKSKQSSHRSNLFKNLYIDKGMKQKIQDVLKGEMGQSEFVRGLVDYYYINKIEKANPKIKKLKEKLKHARLEPTKTIPDENGVYFYFKF
jgi:hypothetical protein